MVKCLRRCSTTFECLHFRKIVKECEGEITIMVERVCSLWEGFALGHACPFCPVTCATNRMLVFGSWSTCCEAVMCMSAWQRLCHVVSILAATREAAEVKILNLDANQLTEAPATERSGSPSGRYQFLNFRLLNSGWSEVSCYDLGSHHGVTAANFSCQRLRDEGDMHGDMHCSVPKVRMENNRVQDTLTQKSMLQADEGM